MKSLSKFATLLVLFSFMQCQSSPDPSTWSETKLNKWFESGQYLNGLQISPDPLTDRRTFAEHYYDHKEVWDKVFVFFKNTDLANLPLGRTELGDNMYVTVSEPSPRDRETTLFEAHQINIDIFYVVSGKEALDVAPLESITVTRPYDAARDVAFGTATEFSELISSPDRLIIVFPSDAHRPGMKAGNDNTVIRRIVMKFPVK